MFPEEEKEEETHNVPPFSTFNLTQIRHSPSLGRECAIANGVEDEEKQQGSMEHKHSRRCGQGRPRGNTDVRERKRAAA
ncbi:hypothetical protein V8C34DRAFT_289631 [Trichoderma compactum]